VIVLKITFVQSIACLIHHKLVILFINAQRKMWIKVNHFLMFQSTIYEPPLITDVDFSFAADNDEFADLQNY